MGGGHGDVTVREKGNSKSNHRLRYTVRRFNGGRFPGRGTALKTLRQLMEKYKSYAKMCQLKCFS